VLQSRCPGGYQVVKPAAWYCKEERKGARQSSESCLRNNMGDDGGKQGMDVDLSLVDDGYRKLVQGQSSFTGSCVETRHENGGLAFSKGGSGAYSNGFLGRDGES
jgi:hypothetical protein